jgi:replicative DNA helicase
VPTTTPPPATTARPAKPPERPAPAPTPAPAPENIVDRLPKELSAEAAVVGSIIIDPDSIDGALPFLPNGKLFFREENGLIYDVLVELHQAGKPIDAMILYRTLAHKGILEQVGGIDYIKELANAVPTSAHAPYYAAMVLEAAQKRAIISAGTTLLRDVYDSQDNAETLCNRALATLDTVNAPLVAAYKTSAEMMDETFEQMERAEKGDRGLPFPFFKLQGLTMGMHRGESILVAGRPGTGKSAFAQAIIEHLSIDLADIQDPYPTAVFSLEMNAKDWGMRLLSSRSGVPIQKMRRGGPFTREERDGMNRAKEAIRNAPIYPDDHAGLTPALLRSKLRRLVRRQGVRLAVIDYLQLMEAGKRVDVREQEVAYISRQCKNLARELDIPIILLCQLNRQNVTQKRKPEVSDLRESGSLEQDADVVLLLHREWEIHKGDHEWIRNNFDKEHIAECLIRKQRNGPCDDVELVFYGPTTSYLDKETAFTRGILS